MSAVFGGTPELKFGWPTPVNVRDEPLASGPLSGSVTDFGDNRVTVRFIRLP